MKYVPCIFSLLPCGVNTLKISFQFFAPEMPVSGHRFQCLRLSVAGAAGAHFIVRAFAVMQETSIFTNVYENTIRTLNLNLRK